MADAARREHPIAAVVGRWASWIQTALLALYTAGLAGLILAGPSGWTDLEAYRAGLDQPWHSWLSLCHVCAFVAPLVLFVMFASVHHTTVSSRRVLTTIGLGFSGMHATLGSINYFLQLTAVQTSLRAGQTAGMEPFVQLNPHSVAYALAILGWTVFLGIASLFVAAALVGEGAARVARWALLVNALACSLGVIGFLTRSVALDLTYVMVMGASLAVASVGLAIHFRKHGERAEGAPTEPSS